MISLLELVKALTSDELRATLLSILTTLGFPVSSWHLGSVIRAMVSLFAAVLSPFTDLQVQIARSGFLDWAEELWLDLLAEQVFDTPRIKATFAVGSVTLSNAGGGSFPFLAQAFRVFNPTTKKVYRNTGPFTLNPLQVGLIVPVEAIEEGSASTSSAGTITSIETVLIGVTVINDAAVVGFDAETDVALRLRCRLKFASLSPAGARDAYEYLALTFALNGGVTITRTSGIFDSATGQSTLYVAGPSGPVSAPNVALIQAQIDRLVAPIGFDCTVASAVAKNVTITSQVWVYTSQNLLSGDVQAAVASQLASWAAALPIGGDFTSPGAGFVFVNTLVAQILKAVTVPGAGQQIHQVGMFTPLTDTAIAASEVVVLVGGATVVNQVTG